MDKERVLVTKKNGFTLIELLVVVAILGVIAAIGVVAYSGYTKSAKELTCTVQHNNVKKFIHLSINKCQIGQDLILKYSYSKATGKLVETSNLCPLVYQSKATQFANAIWAHFNAPPDYNCYGLKHSDGSCQQAVASGGAIGNGKLGETQIFSTSTEIIIDTKISDTKVLNDTIKVD